jgi:hypothetical protein
VILLRKNNTLLVDAPDLKSVVPQGTCPFESDRGHHNLHAVIN